MLPKAEDYFFDHQDEHWVNNPFIPDRQKIRMFEDMMTLTKKVGTLQALEDLRAEVRNQIKISKDLGGLIDRELIPGLMVVERMINDELSRIREGRQ